MPPRQKSLTRGRWRSFALSLLLHSAIVAGAVLAWKYWKSSPPPVETAGVQGTLVDESVLKNVKPAPTPEPTPPPPEPEPLPPEPAPEEVGPPKPDPAEIERKQEEDRKAQEKLEQEKVEQQKREQDQKAEQERIENEKQAAVKAAAEKATAEKAAADKKKAEEAAAKKRAADAAAAKKAADEKARQAQEAELRKSLEAEERASALQNSSAANNWHAAIVQRIQNAWKPPASAQPGVECIVLVSQVPGGVVTSASVQSCNVNDEAIRQSVVNAVLNASPLPEPPDPALFERNLKLIFAPK